VEKGAGPGVDEVVDLRLVFVVEVGVVVLIGEGFKVSNNKQKK